TSVPRGWTSRNIPWPRNWTGYPSAPRWGSPQEWQPRQAFLWLHRLDCSRADYLTCALCFLDRFSALTHRCPTSWQCFQRFWHKLVARWFGFTSRIERRRTSCLRNGWRRRHRAHGHDYAAAYSAFWHGTVGINPAR